MDRIILKGMQFYGRHGVLPAEQELGQRFEVDVEMTLNLRPAGRTDDLEKTVSYADVYRLTEEIVTGPPCRLIEAVAEKIATAVLERFAVQDVIVRVQKPGAPLPGRFDYMAVQIERRR
ncbi:dihydroneopterin aldolase [Desulfotomaculum copahuensis]|nr:dihydroneopterin aldolase [Desulfotomaculum copahuensis]